MVLWLFVNFLLITQPVLLLTFDVLLWITNFPVTMPFKIQNTQEIKRTLFDWMKWAKTCTLSRKYSFSSYIQNDNNNNNKHHQQQKNKQLIQLESLSVGRGRLAGEKGLESICNPISISRVYLPPFNFFYIFYTFQVYLQSKQGKL